MTQEETKCKHYVDESKKYDGHETKCEKCGKECVEMLQDVKETCESTASWKVYALLQSMSDVCSSDEFWRRNEYLSVSSASLKK